MPDPKPELAAAGPWDVLVVGAGPAGSLAARQSAALGLRTLLVDRAAFPRPKVCGCCLNAAALAALDHVGLAGVAGALGGIGLHRVRIVRGRQRATLPLPPGIAVSRAALDQALAAAARSAGATFLDRCSAELGPAEADARVVRLIAAGATLHAASPVPGGPTLRVGSSPSTGATSSAATSNGATARLAPPVDSMTVRARVVIAADGLGGSFLARDPAWRPSISPRSRVGAGVTINRAPDAIEPGTITMACGDTGYVGLVRVERHQLNIAAAFDLRFVRAMGGPGPAAEAILAGAGLPPVSGLADAPWRGTTTLTRRRPVVARDHVMLVGDAAGYVEPFTGEGIAWALAGAEALAPLLPRAVECWSGPVAREWTRLHRAIVLRRQRCCGAIAWALRRPVVSAAAMALVAHAPPLAAPLIRGAAGVVPAWRRAGRSSAGAAP